MTEPTVVSGHHDLITKPVVPTLAEARKKPPPGSAPVYSKFNEKTRLRSYPASAPIPRRFYSIVAKLRIQLVSEPPAPTAAGWTPGRTRYLKFDDGQLITSDVEEILTIEDSSRYGISIWDIDAIAIAEKEQKYTEALELVKQDPELAKRLKVDINKKDFFEKDESTQVEDE